MTIIKKVLYVEELPDIITGKRCAWTRDKGNSPVQISNSQLLSMSLDTLIHMINEGNLLAEAA